MLFQISTLNIKILSMLEQLLKLTLHADGSAALPLEGEGLGHLGQRAAGLPGEGAEQVALLAGGAGQHLVAVHGLLALVAALHQGQRLHAL